MSSEIINQTSYYLVALSPCNLVTLLPFYLHSSFVINSHSFVECKIAINSHSFVECKIAINSHSFVECFAFRTFHNIPAESILII